MGLLCCRMILYHLNHQGSPYLKGNQSWIFIRKTDAKVETPILWAPDAKSQLIGKYPDPGKGWRQEEKKATEDEVVGCHHWLNGHELEQTPGDCEGQGSLTCCSSWGYTQSDMIKQLSKNNTWQQVMTNSVAGLRSSSKLLPKAKLAAENVMVIVSWSAASLNHYNFLNLNETIISEKYTQ